MIARMTPEEFRQRAGEAYRKYSWLFWLVGLLFIIAGIVAIALPHIASLAVEIFLGWLLLITGVVGLGNAVFGKQRPGWIWDALAGLLGLVAGILLLVYPLQGTVTVTLILSIFFFVEGLAKIVSGLSNRHAAGWGWMVFNGLAGVILAILIWIALPQAAAWVLGLLVGINLLLFGVAVIMSAIAVRRATS
ncbi:HdeD family acid-resistance protein [Marinibaculum pumilum]|uniref:HdeD family acid-resistance protein n=1 Tax=Marinibaculum pumilum TaxID=1766165 RepID=A0ABV7L908_9PROT